MTSSVRSRTTCVAGPSGDMTRRRVLGLGVAGLAGVGLAACGGRERPATAKRSGAVELTMLVALGADLGVMPQEFKARWEASHPNVRIRLHEESISAVYPKMLARKKTNPDKPLINLGFFTGLQSEQGVLDGMWAKLDYGAMPNVGTLRPEYKRDDGYGVPISLEQFGLTLNPEHIAAPSSWTALWDAANDDKVTYFGFPWYALYMAAVVNGGSGANLEPGWKALTEHASNIRALVTSNPEFLNVLTSGTAPLSAFLAGTTEQWIRSGSPFSYVVPDEGALALPVSLHSAAGQSPAELEACQEIINEMVSPNWNARWAETSVQIPVQSDVTLPPRLAKLPAFQPATVDGLVQADYRALAKDLAKLAERWQRDVVPKI